MLEIKEMVSVFEILSMKDQTFESALLCYQKQINGDPFKICVTLYRLLFNKVTSSSLDSF